MPGSADTNLVLAAVDALDSLHARARKHLQANGPLRVPVSVGIELLQVAYKRRENAVGLLAQAARDFDVDAFDLLAIAARSMDRGMTPMDAVHLADAVLRREPLHTADKRLHKTPLPTVAW